jgi:uncharacterized membrane protein YdbT with pleckstrin-like domain
MVAQPEEQVVVDARRHGIVLVKPLVRASLLAAAGGAGVLAGWPLSLPGFVLLLLAALAATLAVCRWERTRVVVTSEKLFVVHGLLRRRAAAVRLQRIGPVELEQSLPGRLLGYGTVFAGGLEIRYVPQANRVVRLVDLALRSAAQQRVGASA